MNEDRVYKAKYRPDDVAYDIEVEMTLSFDEKGDKWITIKDGDDVTMPFRLARELATIIEDWHHYR